MTLANSTIGLIRSFFNQSRGIPQPETMQNLVWGSIYPSFAGTAAGGIAPLSEGNSLVQNALNINMDLLTKYADFQDMSQYPECFSALNFWADESTQTHVIENHSVWFDTDNEQIKNILDFTFHKQLHIENQIWQIARNIAKYGNAFKELVVQDGIGVIKLIGHKSQYMRRIQDPAGNLFGFLEDPTMAFKITTEEFLQRLYYGSEHITQKSADTPNKDQCKIYEPWEVCHWRLDGDDGDDLYGISNLEAARWAWKRLQMMEDALLIGKLTKSPQRYVYYVDVGDVPPNEARKILNTVKQEFQKQKMMDNCLTGDTLISCLDGVHRSIKELSDRFEEDGKPFWVYSYDLSKEKVVPGKAIRAVLSGKKRKVYRVRLDSGAVIRCTDDHPFLMRDGEYKKAIDLKKGDSLMPLYLHELRKDGYLGMRDSENDRTVLMHQHIAEQYYDEAYKLKGLHVHHINENKFDNRPENLSLLSRDEHLEIHDYHYTRINKARNSFCDKVKNDNTFKQEIVDRLSFMRRTDPEKYKEVSENTRRVNTGKSLEITDSEINLKIVEMIKDILLQKPYFTIRLLCDYLNDTQDFILLWNSYSDVTLERINPSALTYLFVKLGYKGFSDYRKLICGRARGQSQMSGKYKKDASELASKDDPIRWKQIIEIMKEIVQLDPLVCGEELCDRLNNNEEFLLLWRSLSRTRMKYIDATLINYIFVKEGYGGFGNFKLEVTGQNKRRFKNKGIKEDDIINHKVLSVDFDGYEDVYDLTVEKYHNFAVTAGVFVHNTGQINWKYNPMSQMDDVFIARRKDKRSTEIEVLSGIDSQSIADTEYFRNKLISGLGITKSYLGYDETVGRANLGTQDLRMARSTLRLQKCMKMGLRQIADVDLSARNIDPHSVDFDICMTVPSGALEIAHVEVAKAKAELCQLYQGLNIPDAYLWSEILGMSDGEIEAMEMLRSAQPMPSESPGGEAPSGGNASTELPPENPEVTGEKPAETPAVGNEIASKYRKIPRDKQIVDSKHIEVLNRILATDNNVSKRITEVKYLINDIKAALPRRKY